MSDCIHRGRCALCGEECELTFEHVPPKAAFNSAPSKFVTGDEVIKTVTENRLPWDLAGLRYQNRQRGTGFFSLCRECNSFTGVHYGAEYKRVATDFARMMHESDIKAGSTLKCKARFKPLAFVKQVLSMFCSVNRDIAGMEEIRSFVLNKESTAFPNNLFHLGMYLTLGELERFAMYNIQVMNIDGIMKIIELSEISAFPLGFVLFFNDPANQMSKYLDITSYTEVPWDEECQREIMIPVYECNTMFPMDYRSKEELKLAWKDDR